MDTPPTTAFGTPGIDRCADPRPTLTVVTREAAVERHRPTLLVAAPWCALAAAIGAATGLPTFGRLGAAAIGVLLSLAATVDVRTHRLPNRLVGGAFAVAMAGAASSGDVAVVQAAVGALLAGGLLLGVHLSRGVGMGDVKAAAAIGAAVGPAAWWAAPTAIASAALVASAWGLARGVRRLPLGPALAVGWSVASIAVRWR